MKRANTNYLSPFLFPGSLYGRSILYTFLLLAGNLFYVNGVEAQNTYVWSGPSGGVWGLSTNWTPSRTSPAGADIIKFNTGTNILVVDVPNQTIGKLQVSNSTNVTLRNDMGGNRTLTVSAA